MRRWEKFGSNCKHLVLMGACAFYILEVMEKLCAVGRSVNCNFVLLKMTNVYLKL